MKILLISPYSDISAMGLRSLSAYVKKFGHETRMIFLPFTVSEISQEIDFHHRYSEKILEQVCELAEGTDLIGLSVMTNYFLMVKSLARHLRKLDIPIVVGGVHASIRPEECLTIADYVCISEGEEALTTLADRLASGESTSDIPNIWLKKDGVLLKNPVNPPIHDLDRIPYFDYDFEDQFVLEQEREELIPLNREQLRKFLTREVPTKARASLFYQTIASRGCPYACTFCCWGTMKEDYNLASVIRRRSNSHIIGELEWVRKELPFIKEIVFSDDSFFAVSRDEAREFRDLYKDKVNLPFQCLADLRTVNREKMAFFSDAGMVNIQIGVQTGSESVKKMYGRAISNKSVLDKVTIINEFIPPIRPPIYDFILDNPWETVDDKIETLHLLLKFPRPYFLQLFTLTFFPGTALYERAKSESLITDEYKEIYEKHYNNDRKITYVNLLFSLFSRPVPLFFLRILCHPISVHLFNRDIVTGALRSLYHVFVRGRMLLVSHRK